MTDLSDYEQQRLANIQANRAELQRLGIERNGAPSEKRASSRELAAKRRPRPVMPAAETDHEQSTAAEVRRVLPFDSGPVCFHRVRHLFFSSAAETVTATAPAPSFFGCCKSNAVIILWQFLLCCAQNFFNFHCIHLLRPLQEQDVAAVSAAAAPYAFDIPVDQAHFWAQRLTETSMPPGADNAAVQDMHPAFRPTASLPAGSRRSASSKDLSADVDGLLQRYLGRAIPKLGTQVLAVCFQRGFHCHICADSFMLISFPLHMLHRNSAWPLTYIVLSLFFISGETRSDGGGCTSRLSEI